MRRALRFLTAEQVLAMHAALLDRAGGARGGGHRGSAYEGVDAAVQAVKNSYYGTVEELAAAYAIYIVRGHVFLDGNKRTAAAAMLTFLEANGVVVGTPAERIAALVVEAQRRAAGGRDLSRAVRWLAGELAQGRRRTRRR